MANNPILAISFRFKLNTVTLINEIFKTSANS